MGKKWDYKSAGVDVTAGYEAVRQMKQHVRRTITGGVLGGLGGFGGMFQLPTGYKTPVLVSGTDGVGTKLKIAFAMQKHDTIGIDCVAMSVNDIICQGAKPLFFLDYIGTGILEPHIAADIVKGISEGCVQSGAALVGGETAEMPGFYKKGEYDLAGFCVGIAEKEDIITGNNIKAGDVLIGVASSGIHSNGYSLVNKLVEYKNKNLNEYVPELSKTLGEELLTPTKIYVKLVMGLIESFKINAIGHITGGGWEENIPRIFSGEQFKAEVKRSAVPVPPIFTLLQQWGNVEEKNMYETYNMGMGLILAVPAETAEAVMQYIHQSGEKAYIVGEVIKRKTGEGGVEFV